MKIYATAEIQISCDELPLKTVRKLRSELDQAFEDAADAVLEKHGIANDEMYTIIVGELITDDDDDEG